MTRKNRFEFKDGVLIEPPIDYKEKALEVAHMKNVAITLKASFIILTLITFSSLFNAINSLDLKNQTHIQQSK